MIIRIFKATIPRELDNEFIMISRWEKEEDLIRFAGDSWNEAHIPKGMEKYFEHCSVNYYLNIDMSNGG